MKLLLSLRSTDSFRIDAMNDPKHLHHPLEIVDQRYSRQSLRNAIRLNHTGSYSEL